MPDQAPQPARGRRATDHIPAAVALAIEQGLSETRHAIRTDLTILGQQVAAGNLQSVKDHAEVRAQIRTLRADVTELKALTPRVIALERDEGAQAAIADAMDKLRRSVIALAGLLIAVVAAIAAILH